MTKPEGSGTVPPKPQQAGSTGSPPAYGELYRSTDDSAPDDPGNSPPDTPRHRAALKTGMAATQRSSRWWLAAIAGAGIPVGVLWWLLAPGGMNLLTGDPSLTSGSNPQGWLPRDLVLAGLFLFAGCLTGMLLTGKRTGAPAPGAVVLAVISGALGAVIAWRMGILAGQWWGAAEDTSPNASIAFSLRAYAVLAIWPAAVAVSVFVVNLVSLMSRAPVHDA